MSNWNTQRQTLTVLNVSGNAVSALTTGTVSSFFPATDVPGEYLCGAAQVTAAAETASTNLHLHTSQNGIIPTRAIIRVVTAPTFSGGTSPTVTAQLVIGDATTSANDAACSAATAIVSASTTALTAGAAIQVNMGPVASGSSLCRNGKVIKLQLVTTGSATSWSGTFEIQLHGSTYVYNV